MKENLLDIVLIYPSDFPDDIINNEVCEFASENLNIKIQKNDNEPFACFEWIIPTAFGVYILKPYFESFLSEMGKDHYTILKRGLKNFSKKGKQFRLKLLTATQSTEKISGNYNQSLSISITIQTKNNKQIKMLFDDTLEKEDWDFAIDELLNYLIENYESFPNDKLSNLLNEKVEKEHELMYGIINPISKQIEFYNERELRRKYK